MKILNTTIPSMYAWTMLLISVLAAAESFIYKQVPWNLLVSVLAASVLDMALKKFYLKQQLKVPYSAIITGLIIGSVAPINSPILLGVAAAAIAIFSKIFIRVSGFHIFNPATIGLLISLLLFTQGDQWWAANGYSYLAYVIPIPLILLFANYKASKLFASIPFLLTTFAIGIVIAALNGFQVTALGAVMSVLQLNFFLAFIMVSEPKTSPYKKNEQVVFGVGVALLTFALSFFNVNYTLLVSLLLGNLAYALWRSRSSLNSFVSPEKTVS